MIEQLEKELSPLRTKLLTHELYKNIKSIEDVRIFMESHVFAVWDFMSLLTALQQELTCTTLPWVPKGSPRLRRFINEIVIAEESDLNQSGEAMSHFEMYLTAMVEMQADVSNINSFIKQINKDQKYIPDNYDKFLSRATQDFMDFTFEVITTKKAHIIASAFTFGRENLIPEMFTEIVNNLNKSSNQQLSNLVFYLDRHIEIDGDEHGPISLKMVEELCQDDTEKWNEAIEASKQALITRIALWDHINTLILNK